jgi:hypothetical protein
MDIIYNDECEQIKNDDIMFASTCIYVINVFAISSVIFVLYNLMKCIPLEIVITMILILLLFIVFSKSVFMIEKRISELEESLNEKIERIKELENKINKKT